MKITPVIVPRASRDIFGVWCSDVIGRRGTVAEGTQSILFTLYTLARYQLDQTRCCVPIPILIKKKHPKEYHGCHERKAHAPMCSLSLAKLSSLSILHLRGVPQLSYHHPKPPNPKPENRRARTPRPPSNCLATTTLTAYPHLSSRPP